MNIGCLYTRRMSGKSAPVKTYKNVSVKVENFFTIIRDITAPNTRPYIIIIILFYDITCNNTDNFGKSEGMLKCVSEVIPWVGIVTWMIKR